MGAAINGDPMLPLNKSHLITRPGICTVLALQLLSSYIVQNKKIYHRRSMQMYRIDDVISDRYRYGKR